MMFWYMDTIVDVVFAVLLLGLAWDIYKRWIAYSDWEKVQGVVNASYSVGRGGMTLRYSYTFLGQQYTGTETSGGIRKMQVGTPVTLLVNPKNPKQTYVYFSPKSVFLIPKIVLGIFALFILAGLLYFQYKF